MKLQPGDAAPDFTIPTAGGGTFSLSEAARGGAGVVVYFYPRASTPGCTTQACDFRNSLAPLQAAGYQVIGVSPDKIPALDKFAAAKELPFPLGSDPDHQVLAAWGAWGEKKNYGLTTVGVIRSTVVIDTDMRVTHAYYNVKATGHVARLRAELGL